MAVVDADDPADDPSDDPLLALRLRGIDFAGDVRRVCLARSRRRTGDAIRFNPAMVARPTRPARFRTLLVVSRPRTAIPAAITPTASVAPDAVTTPAAAPAAMDAVAPSANAAAPAAKSPAARTAEADAADAVAAAVAVPSAATAAVGTNAVRNTLGAVAVAAALVEKRFAPAAIAYRVTSATPPTTALPT